MNRAREVSEVDDVAVAVLGHIEELEKTSSSVQDALVYAGFGRAQVMRRQVQAQIADG